MMNRDSNGAAAAFEAGPRREPGGECGGVGGSGGGGGHDAQEVLEIALVVYGARGGAVTPEECCDQAVAFLDAARRAAAGPVVRTQPEDTLGVVRDWIDRRLEVDRSGPLPHIGVAELVETCARETGLAADLATVVPQEVMTRFGRRGARMVSVAGSQCLVGLCWRADL